MATHEQMVTAHAIVLYFYNVSPDGIFQEVYGDGKAASYMAEKVRAICRGFSSFFGELDTQHQDRLITVVTERYGDEAERRMGV